MAALRFAAQPFDDLNLAALLVSPLIGWSQEQLLEHGYRARKVRLWDHLRRAVASRCRRSRWRELGELLAQGRFRSAAGAAALAAGRAVAGRASLVARLGREANDPIDELLNAAHAYAMAAMPSLAGFLAWFDAGEGELKREADNARRAGAGDDRPRRRRACRRRSSSLPMRPTIPTQAGRGEMLDLADPPNAGRAACRCPGLRKEEHGRPHRRGTREASARGARGALAAALCRDDARRGGAVRRRRAGQRSEKEPAPDSWYAAAARAVRRAATAVEDADLGCAARIGRRWPTRCRRGVAATCRMPPPSLARAG